MDFRTLKFAIYEALYWGVSKISSKWVDVKKGGIKYKEGDRISLPTVDPDISEYKAYIVAWFKVIMMV